ncbi:FKBP-type peptidyl-prolyl cis-trans isomerase [Microbacterium sp. X-17]|uniref:FKBP-type peptidyl-prolyl cis-trans isomerase n=1 Tax=Microbacterium sp. X-17 TaxID=3144404 RepID=UPI0031F49977
MRVRSLAVLSIAAVAALLLAGCSAAGAPAASPSASGDLCAAAAAPGTASDAVTTSGDIGTAPTVTFTAPLAVTAVQRTVDVVGTGPAIKAGDYVQYGLTQVAADTGTVAGSVGYGNAPIEPVQVAVGSGIDQAFGCATVGSRIVVTQPGAQSNPPRVLVIDVLGITTGDSWCAPADTTVPFPSVAFDASGAPTITIPANTTPPTAVALETLTPGNGDVVQPGDNVTVNYTGVKWSDGSVFDSSWAKGDPATFPTSGVIAGFRRALEGQKVGSTELVVIPPVCGYGPAGQSGNTSPLAGETLVFVVNIISTAPNTQQ